MKAFKKLYLVLILGLFASLLFINIKGFFYNCFDAYDLGLYAQGLQDVASFNSFNPYVEIRGLKLLNDHFIPAAYLSIPFLWIFNFSPIGLIVFEWVIFLLFIFIAIRHHKNNFNAILLCCSYIIFCKGFITALIFPVHPGVWSLPLWFFLLKEIQNNNFKKVLVYSFTLMLFKESIPFAIISLSTWYFLQKKNKEFLSLFLGGVLYSLFVMKGRAYLMGETYPYGKEILSPLFSDTINYISHIFKSFKYDAFFKSTYPFLIPLFLIIKKDFKSYNNKLSHPFIAAAFLIAPLFMIQFIAGKWDHQYIAPMAAILLSLIIQNPVFSKIANSKRLASFSILLFIISSMSYYKRFYRLLYLKESPRCVLTDQKRSDLKELKTHFESIDSDQKVLSTRKVIPSLIRPGLGVWSTHYFTKHLGSYDVLVFEKEFLRAGNKIDSDYKNLKSNCQNSKIAFENQSFLVLKENIDVHCYRHLKEPIQKISY